MPLLNRRPFGKRRPPKDLRLDEEIFFCRLTAEVYRDYNEFFERIILCNSLVWSCSMTGKSNLTFQEALESEKKASKLLEDLTAEIKQALLFLASLTSRGRMSDVCDDVLRYSRDRYFKGECIQGVIDDLWCECRIVKVIPPTEGELSEHEVAEVNGSSDDMKKSPGDGNFWPPAYLFHYKVEELDPDDPSENEILLLDAEDIRRPKGFLTKDKVKMYLKQCMEVTGEGVFKLKKKVSEKLKIDILQFSEIFAGPTPVFESTPDRKISQRISSTSSPTKRKRSKSSDVSAEEGKKRKRRSTSSKSPGTNSAPKRRKVMEEGSKGKAQKMSLEGSPRKGGEQKKRKGRISDKEKNGSSNAQSRKSRKSANDEKRNSHVADTMTEEERIKEEKKLMDRIMKEWNKPREDLECNNLRDLPKPTPINCLIPNHLFGDFMMVLEFMHSFASILNLKSVFAGGLSFDLLERALVEKEVGGPLYDVLQVFLRAIFNLQEEEEDGVGGTEDQVPVDLDVDKLGTDVTFEEAMEMSSNAATWSQTYQGCPLSQLTMDPLTLTEVLRLHLLSSGGRNGAWENKHRSGYSGLDDPGLHFRLDKPHILQALSVGNVYELTIGDKLKIFDCLVNQILMYASVRDLIDESFEKIRMAKGELRSCSIAGQRRSKKLAEESIKKVGEGIAADEDGKLETKLLPKKETVEEKSLEVGEAQEEVDHQARLQKEKELHKALQLYSSKIGVRALGKDRAYRRYWTFRSMPGLFVEHDDAFVGDCLPHPTPYDPEATPLNQDYASRILQMLQKKKSMASSSDDKSGGGGGSDKENEVGQMLRKVELGRGTMNSRQKKTLAPKNNGILTEASPRRNSSGMMAVFHGEELGTKTPENLLLLRQPVFGMCTGNNSDCPVHNTSLPKVNWSLFHDEETFSSLLENLNPRGIRENKLKNVLKQEQKRIIESFALCPVHKLDQSQNPKVMPEVRKSNRSSKKSSDTNQPPGMTADCFLEMLLRERLLDFELKIYSKRLGNLNGEDRVCWCQEVNDKLSSYYGLGKNDEQSLESDKSTSDESLKIDEKCKDKLSGIEIQDTPTKKENGIKLEEGAAQFQENDHGSDVEANKLAIKELAAALLQLGQSINLKYMGKPLAESEKEKKKRRKAEENERRKRDKDKEEAQDGNEEGSEDGDNAKKTVKTPFDRWQISLMACSSWSQLLIHLSTLYKSIKWSSLLVKGRCFTCSRRGDRETMLQCEQCDRWQHIDCLKIKLSSIPSGEWFCSSCQAKAEGGSPGNSDAEEDEEYKDMNESDCAVCKQTGCLICCDTCPLVYHQECVYPPLRAFPRGKWSCPKCRGFTIPTKTFYSSPMEEASKTTKTRRVHSTKDPELSEREQSRNMAVNNVRERRRCANEAVMKIARVAKRLRGDGSWDGDLSVTEENKETLKQSPEHSEQSRRISSRRSRGDDDSGLNLAVLYELVGELMKHEDGWPFLRPVSKADAVDYFQVIKRPMDFGTMKYKLNSMQYTSSSEFVADAFLVFDNCQMYNRTDTPEYRAGSRLSSYFTKRCKEMGLTLVKCQDVPQAKSKGRNGSV